MKTYMHIPASNSASYEVRRDRSSDPDHSKCAGLPQYPRKIVYD